MSVVEGWKKYRVRDVCDLGRGRVINGQEIERNPGVFPVYSSQSSNNGKMGSIDTFDFDGEYVTWTTDGAYAGTVFYRSGQFNCTNVCGTLHAKDSRISMPFIAYKLSSLAKEYVSYVGNPKLMNGVMANIELSIPTSKPEQSKIAEILSTVDRAIEQTEALIAKHQRIKTGLMQDLLTRGIDEHGNLRTEQTHKFKDSPLGRIPVEWKVRPFNDCVSIVEGQKDPRKLPYRDWILIAPDHVETRTGRLIELKTAYDQGAISGKYEFRCGDVVYSKIRPYLRKAVLVDFDGLCSADMYPLRPKDYLTPDFLFLTILSEPFSLYAESVSARSGFPKINRTELSGFMMCVPSIEEQTTITNILHGHGSDIEELNRTFNKFRTIKTALTQDLLTGKKRVTTLLSDKEINSRRLEV